MTIRAKEFRKWSKKKSDVLRTVSISKIKRYATIYSSRREKKAIGWKPSSARNRSVNSQFSIEIIISRGHSIYSISGKSGLTSVLLHSTVCTCVCACVCARSRSCVPRIALINSDATVRSRHQRKRYRQCNDHHEGKKRDDSFFEAIRGMHWTSKYPRWKHLPAISVHR